MELFELEEKYIDNPNKENRKRLLKKLNQSDLYVRYDQNDNPLLLTDEQTGDILICIDREPVDEFSKLTSFKDCLQLKKVVKEVLKKKVVLVLDIDEYEIDIPEDVL
ncbi:MAG: hypothetical protein J6E46_04540 [Faecalicoccus sp.]|nr:hypothetical protein [Faecalicoccus sp.]